MAHSNTVLAQLLKLIHSPGFSAALVVPGSGMLEPFFSNETKWLRKIKDRGLVRGRVEGPQKGVEPFLLFVTQDDRKRGSVKQSFP
ncbi:MAG: hypothetical protein CSA33_00060 [Desulfobulbus propionicus]|nr:MAG: hypothetical protein CSA33_00060 [Desulfobulbus propionicus]